MGSDSQLPWSAAPFHYFNPRSRMGSDTRTLHINIGVNNISIHAPAWGATELIIRTIVSKVFQSTLPHGERPQRCKPSDTKRLISIHAPAWGATTALKQAQTANTISIHAPAWGATFELRILFCER